MSKARYVSINNEIVPEAEAKIGINDLSIQRGYGIFDFLKVIDNTPIFIDDHLNRFFRSAAEMYLEPAMDRPALKQAIHKVMEANGLPGSAIKIILTGGYSEDGYTMGKPNLIITQVPFVMEDNVHMKGLNLVTYNYQRQLPTIKTIDYLQAIRLRPFIKSSNADDVLYHNNNVIGECPRANFFIVTEDEIVTPKDNILSGIIRSKVLKLQIDNYSIVERNITLNDLGIIKEAFITSSTKNAWPVIAIDGKQIGDGKTGKITSLISEKLNELMFSEIYSM
jgi:branched-chain amino acid aminotransferase